MITERDRDKRLVERVQQGETIAFDALMMKYQRKLFRLILRLTGNSSEAEDVVQETFIKAYSALPHFRGDSAFYTWLYRIAINTAKNFLDNRGRRVPVSMDATGFDMEFSQERESLRDLATPESVLASKQMMQTINLAMEELPDDLRRALSLREVDGLSYDEIALVMNCPIGTVRSRIFRARESIAIKLRPFLETAMAARGG